MHTSLSANSDLPRGNPVLTWKDGHSTARTRTCELWPFVYRYPKNQRMANHLIEKTEWLKTCQKRSEELTVILWIYLKITVCCRRGHKQLILTLLFLSFSKQLRMSKAYLPWHPGVIDNSYLGTLVTNPRIALKIIGRVVAVTAKPSIFLPSHYGR